jgi:plastocyanin
MQRRNLERTYRLFTMIGYLLLGLSGITGSEQMVQPAFAASATVATMHPTTQHSATATPEDIVSQQIATPPEKAGGVKVSIANFTFTPAEVRIAPGETVTWTNDDGAPHGLEYQDGAKGTDLLLPGASFSRQFDQPGTYDYNCSVHPYMTGRVVVRAQ